MMAERGFSPAHTTIMRWIRRYVPEFEKRWNCFARPAGQSWRVDETYVKIKGRWTLYPSLPRRRQRGKDRRCSASRQARCRGRQSVLPSGFQGPGSTCGGKSRSTAIKLRTERRVNCSTSIKAARGPTIRSSKYSNNLIEQDHRSIKIRLRPMLGLKRIPKRLRSTSPVSNSCTGSEKLSSNYGKLRVKNKTAPEIWNAVLGCVIRVRLPSAFLRRSPAFAPQPYCLLRPRRRFLKGKGRTIPSHLLKHVSPVSWEHINVTGTYSWRTEPTDPTSFRPLREEKSCFGLAA